MAAKAFENALGQKVTTVDPCHDFLDIFPILKRYIRRRQALRQMLLTVTAPSPAQTQGSTWPWPPTTTLWTFTTCSQANGSASAKVLLATSHTSTGTLEVKYAVAFKMVSDFKKLVFVHIVSSEDDS